MNGIDWRTVFSGVTTAAVLAMATFVLDMKTDVAVMKKDITYLIDRDVVTQGELLLALSQLDFPWQEDRKDVLRRISRLERKAGVEGD